MTETKAPAKYDPDVWESIVTLVAVLGGWALRAWMALLAWAWFIVPLGVQPVGFWWMVVAVFVMPSAGPARWRDTAEPATEKEYWQRIGAILGTPLVGLLAMVLVRGIVA